MKFYYLLLVVGLIQASQLTVDQKSKLTVLFNEYRYKLSYGTLRTFEAEPGLLQPIYWNTDVEKQQQQMADEGQWQLSGHRNYAWYVQTTVDVPQFLQQQIENNLPLFTRTTISSERTMSTMFARQLLVQSQEYVSCVTGKTPWNGWLLLVCALTPPTCPWVAAYGLRTGDIPASYSFDLAPKAAPNNIFGSSNDDGAEEAQGTSSTESSQDPLAQPDLANPVQATYSSADEEADQSLHRNAQAWVTSDVESNLLNQRPQLNEEERNVALNTHNQCRKQLRLGYMKRNDGTYWPKAQENLPNMAWSYGAEALASDWAQRNNFAHRQDRTLDGKNYGENICISYRSGSYQNPNQVMEKCIVDFYNEGRCSTSIHLSSQHKFVFLSQDTSCVQHVGHFTQVIWSRTTHVGCAYSQFKDNTWFATFIVCNYFPHGNMRDQFIYK